MASITKVKNEDGTSSYRVRVVAGHRPDGTTIQRMRTFRLRKEADSWGREQDQARERGTQVDAGRTTLGEYLRQRLCRCQARVQGGDLAGSTLAGYKMIMERYVLAGSPHASERMALRLDRLRTAHVQDLIDAAPTDYLKGRVRVILRIALGEAERLEPLATNPVKRTTAPSHTPRRGTALTPDQAVAFLRLAREDCYRAYWFLAVYTGCRPSELFGLTWDMVDLATATLRVAKGKVYVFNQAFDSAGKNETSRRGLSMAAALATVLGEWREEQDGQRRALGEAWRAGDLVITSAAGTPVDRGNLTRKYKKLLAEAGIPDLRLYDLRHSFGSLLHRDGVDLETIASAMGHKDSTMLRRTYLHIHEDQRRAAMHRLGGILDGLPGHSEAR